MFVYFAEELLVTFSFMLGLRQAEIVFQRSMKMMMLSGRNNDST
jgi:hypothetical protein